MFLRGVYTHEFQDHDAKNDQCASHEVVEAQRFVEPEVRNAHSHDHRGVHAHGDDRHGQSIDGFVKGERVEESRHESEAKQGEHYVERERQHFVTEREGEERKCDEVQHYRNNRAYQHRHFRRRPVEILAEEQTPEAETQAAQDEQNVSRFDLQSCCEAFQADRYHTQCHQNEREQVPSRPLFVKDHDGEHTEEHHFGIPEQYGIRRRGVSKSREPQERSYHAVAQSYGEHGRELLARDLPQFLQHGHEPEGEDDEEDGEALAHKEQSDGRQSARKNFPKHIVRRREENVCGEEEPSESTRAGRGLTPSHVRPVVKIDLNHE